MPGTALLLIDVQVNMFHPSSSVGAADELLTHLGSLLKRARAGKVPVIFVRNCGAPGEPDAPGVPGWHLHPALQPAADEAIFDKTTSDTFASTALDRELRALGITRLVIAGLQSEYCVKQTTLGALARGYEILLVADGHSTYDGGGETAAQKSAAVNNEFRDRVQLAPAAEVRFE